MQKVTEALESWTPTPPAAYDRRRYPYGYALDFLTGIGSSIIPQEIRDQAEREVMANPNVKGKQRKKMPPARSMAQLMLHRWLKVTGEDEEGVYVAIANKQLKALGIEEPSSGRDL